MKKLNLFLMLFIITTSLLANGLSLNSVGAKALGMGGAFVGQADDLSAIYWNPAALANQSSGISFVLGDIIPNGYYKADDTYFPPSPYSMDIDAEIQTNHYVNPNLFINHRMDKLALGLGIYVPAGLGAEYDGDDLLALSNGVSQKWMSQIAVVNIAPAVAYDLDKFQLGMALNIMYGMFEINRPANVMVDTDGDGVAETPTSFQYEEDSTGLGFGAVLSGLYHINPQISVGATFKTKSSVSMEGEASNPAMAGLAAPTETDFSRDVEWPTWIGLGASFLATEQLRINADIQYSAWAASSEEFFTEFDDATWETVTAATGDDTFTLEWEDAIQYRVGAEYMATECLAVRGGYYYDPAPAPDEHMNILFPSSTNHVGTLGLGYSKNKLSFNVGGEYLFGAERDIEANIVDGEMTNIPGLHRLNVLAFSLGITYRY